MNWTVETLNHVVDNELEALPAEMQARYSRIFKLIKGHGLQNLPNGTVKHLEGKLWEIRVNASSGISRAVYVTATGQRVIILRVFVKKTQRTPQRELEIARQREKEVK